MIVKSQVDAKVKEQIKDFYKNPEKMARYFDEKAEVTVEQAIYKNYIYRVKQEY